MKHVANHSYVLGMDVGGTNTLFGVVDTEGNILARDSVHTKEYADINNYVSEIASRIKRMMQDFGGVSCFNGMGIGAPNGNVFTGYLDYAPNLPWGKAVPLVKLFHEALDGLPVKIDNDANAATIGEMTYGAARDMKNFIMLTLGTGVGSGIVIDGNLVYGSHGKAGELGHVIVRPNGRPCGCGRNGCLETYVSATGVARTAKECLSRGVTVDSLLSKIDSDNITSKDVYDAALQGDPIAKDIFDRTGQVLGEAIASFVNFSDPEAIILFGGLTSAGELLMKPIKESLQKNILFVYEGGVKIIFSHLKGSDAAILGAASLGWLL